MIENLLFEDYLVKLYFQIIQINLGKITHIIFPIISFVVQQGFVAITKNQHDEFLLNSTLHSSFQF